MTQFSDNPAHSGVDIARLDRLNRLGHMAIVVIVQARVVQRMDIAVHRINHYPLDSVVCFC